eukprot:5984429-Pleurochrysis_carterae.AAC.1
MVDLARRACAAEGGGLPLEQGKGLIDKGFRRLGRLAARKRTRAGEPSLDIGEIFRVVAVRDFEQAQQAALVVRVTDAATDGGPGLHAVGANGGRGGRRQAQAQGQANGDDGGDGEGAGGDGDDVGG